MSEQKATFASFDEALEKAVKDGVFVGAVAFARNKTGIVCYYVLAWPSTDIIYTRRPKVLQGCRQDIARGRLYQSYADGHGFQDGIDH